MVFNWQEIFLLQSNLVSPTQQIYRNTSEGLGTLTDFKAKIIVDPPATPKYCKSHSAPYFLRDKVEKELNCLVAEDTLEPVEVVE